MPRSLWLYGVAILILPVLLALPKSLPPGRRQVFLAQTITMIAFTIFSSHAIISASASRSAKSLGEQARPLISAETQVVLYDAYLAGLGFYLRSEKPAWVITESKSKRNFTGNYYALGKRAAPDTRWGKALFDFADLADQWRSTRQPLLVLAKAKSRARLEQQIGAGTKILASVDDYVWLTKK